MNPDDLEQQLRGQPLRQVPAAWRDEILGAARRAGAEASARRGQTTGRPKPWAAVWAQVAGLLWPSPRAWAGLAAIWMVIVSLNLFGRAPAASEGKALPVASAALRMALREQQRVLAQFIEGREPLEPAKGLL